MSECEDGGMLDGVVPDSSNAMPENIQPVYDMNITPEYFLHKFGVAQD